MDIPAILTENDRRNREFYAPYDPETGLGSPLKRFPLKIIGDHILYLPEEMMELEVIQEMIRFDSVVDFVAITFRGQDQVARFEEAVAEISNRRFTYDFEYWAFKTIIIQDKLSLQMVPFRLRRPQRKLLMSFEKQRLAGVPIRTIVCKARQWGGSTLSEIYMMWIQQIHRENWHIAVVAHLDDAAKHIRAMYVRAAKYYPEALGTITLGPYERSSKNMICKEKGCILGVGSVENPDQFHSYAYAMAHLSELGRWSETAKKSANELMQALRPTVPDVPYSMIVMESTANGRGNLFHNEWQAAVSEGSRYDAVFVPWFEIELYRKEIGNKEEFLKRMDSHPMREYYWSLWMKGATLEAINWYMFYQAAENLSDLQMWRQYPSDPEEAFSSTGHRVFSPMVTTSARKYCFPPTFRGQMYSKTQKGKDAFVDLNFLPTINGDLWVWDLPDTTIKVSNRYVVMGDIGGKSDGADYSTIRVFDRFYLLSGGSPEAICTWRGHMDQDLFAWLFVQVAHWYNHALAVLESNSLRKELADADGDQFLTVLDEISDFYDNLYSRTDPGKIKEGVPVQYGFHTNVATKPMVINALNAAWRDDTFIEHDSRVVDEADQFEFRTDGSMGAVEGCHDDLLMPTAIGVWVSESYMDPPRILSEEKKKPVRHKRTEASL